MQKPMQKMIRNLKNWLKQKNNADMLVHATRKTIDESGDKLTDDEKSQVEASVVALEEAIASENTDSIESATKDLNDVLTPLTQKLYAQDADATASADEGDNTQDSEDQNTVDAEYEEVKEEDK